MHATHSSENLCPVLHDARRLGVPDHHRSARVALGALMHLRPASLGLISGTGKTLASHLECKFVT
jgi:hypothetical protein